MVKEQIQRYLDRGNNIKNNYQRVEKENLIINRNSNLTNNLTNNSKNINKDIYIEKNKELKILDSCEVLVVGGGPSGISAAISSSRAGADTIILEKFGCLGGVITTVGMETIAWYRYEGTEDCSGIGTEMENMAKKMGGTRKWAYNDSNCLDAEFFKVVADKLVLESGVRPILHCYAVETILENNTIKGIITESKSGRMVIYADRVIDCTGDADICYLAGVDCRVNKKEEKMSVTAVFNCSNIDKERFIEYTKKNEKTYSDWGGEWITDNNSKESKLKSPYLEINRDKNVNGSWSSITENGEATNLNLVHIPKIDCTNVKDLTYAEIRGRKKTMETIEDLKKELPGFENAKLRNFGMTLGTRDSRKIIGEYNLCKKDVMEQGRFYDSIGIFPEFIDGYNVLTLPTTGRFFQIPFRSLIPKKIDNLLIAGRCIGGDNISHAAMRNMMACCVTGQGAGVAAAISIKNNTIVRNTSFEAIQKELLKQGVSVFNPNLKEDEKKKIKNKDYHIKFKSKL